MDDEPAPDVDDDFAIGRGDGEHRVLYVVDDLAGDASPQRFERLDVRAPFESRLDEVDGPALDADAVTSQVAAFDRLRFGAADNPVVVHRVPGLAPSDLAVAAVLDDAVDAGLLELGDQRLVEGRRCQVLRSATLLGAGHLRAFEDGEHAESCVDADGVLLSETLVVDGEPIFRRVAIEVVDEPALDDSTFEVGPPTAPVDLGGGSVLPVDPDVGAVGRFWELRDDDVPDGFVRTGRYAVVPPQPENFSDPTRADHIVAGVADLYVDGPRAFVIHQGATRGGVDPFAPVDGASVLDGAGLDGLGDGEVLLGAIGSEVRFSPTTGSFVHVTGSVDLVTLEAIAAGLVETEGEGLVYL